MRLDHCCLNVRDTDAAIAFYSDHFGLKLLSRRDIASSNAEIAFVASADEGMKLELTHWRDWTDKDYVDGSNFDHVALVLDDADGDLEAFVARLAAAGVKVAKEPFTISGSGSRIAFVLDGDGNWVELIQKARA